MKSEHQYRVEQFMLKGGQEVPSGPTLPDDKTRLLRAQLILEEALETVNALGFAITQDGTEIDCGHVGFILSGEPDLEKIIDGCCDIKVVTTGTLSACGIPDEPFQEEVDRNNLWKVKDGIKKSPEGKILKPEGWKPPRIKEILHHVYTNYQDCL